jgi:acetylglutamate kinase
VGHLSDETSHPLKREDAVNTETQAVELSHELIVKLVSEMENGIAYVATTTDATKADIKKLKDANRQVSKSVFGRVHEVSYMVNQALQKGITTNKKVSEDSGVSMSTISRYDWIGSTLSVVAMSESGLTKTAEKLASKSLNLLIQGVLKKDDMLNIKDIEGWKQVIQDRTFKLPTAPKLDAVLEAIGNGSYDDSLGKLESALTTRRKMMVKA